MREKLFLNLGECGIMATDVMIDQIIEIVSRCHDQEADSRKDEILYKLARLARNTDGLFPTTHGSQVGRLLSRLRGLDPQRYDKEVIGARRQRRLDADDVVEAINHLADCKSALEDVYQQTGGLVEGIQVDDMTFTLVKVLLQGES